MHLAEKVEDVAWTRAWERAWKRLCPLVQADGDIQTLRIAAARIEGTGSPRS